MIDKQSLLDLMNNADAVYLATVDGSIPRIRAMVNLRRQDLYPGAAPRCRGEGFTVYMATSASSGKIRELRANPNVSTYYCDPRQFHAITLTGKVEILLDPDLKKELWCDDWRIYWPNGPVESDYIVLRLEPVEATACWGTDTFHLDPSET
jgi:general stress protein 26